MSEKGFTLLEIIIALLVIGILASVAIPQYSQFRFAAMDAVQWTTLNS